MSMFWKEINYLMIHSFIRSYDDPHQGWLAKDPHQPSTSTSSSSPPSSFSAHISYFHPVPRTQHFSTIATPIRSLPLLSSRASSFPHSPNTTRSQFPPPSTPQRAPLSNINCLSWPSIRSLLPPLPPPAPRHRFLSVRHPPVPRPPPSPPALP